MQKKFELHKLPFLLLDLIKSLQLKILNSGLFSRFGVKQKEFLGIDFFFESEELIPSRRLDGTVVNAFDKGSEEVIIPA